MVQKIIGTTCDVINNLVGMQVYKLRQEETPMRRRYSKDDSIRVMSELIAKHIDEVSDIDYEDMVAALDYKCSISRLERLVDRITSKSREVAMDDIMRSGDEKQVYKELFEEVFYIIETEKRERRIRGISKSRNVRKPWLKNERDTDEYDNYARDNRSKSNTGLETFAEYFYDYMKRNNIPFPENEQMFVRVFGRARKISNDPDIVAFKGSAKKLYGILKDEFDK